MGAEWGPDEDEEAAGVEEAIGIGGNWRRMQAESVRGPTLPSQPAALRKLPSRPFSWLSKHP